jgi:hypothetical protein
MKWALTTLMMSFIMITFWLWQIDGSMALLANGRLKNGINRAAHDASLQVDKAQLTNGKIVFNSNAAMNTFKNTIAANLVLDDQLIPQPNTLFTRPIAITYMDFIDDLDGVTYPYFYENSMYGISKIIYGPAVIFAIETDKPRPFNISEEYMMVKWAVFEYPIPR